MLNRVLSVALALAAVLAWMAAPASAQVKVWEAPVVVPTYPAAGPDPSPLFYEGRTYQGAKGPIYPYPIIDKLFDTKEDHTYKALWLENEYVRLCVLPELGGRIFEAVDKTNGYNFFYRQHVIKPALIGMLGAWISGGVEWNIPHHHRASSFIPVEYKLEEHADGSKTIWVGEMELRHRMRWVMGLTLRPGKAYVEATLRLFNETPVTNSFLYFANVSVHTNENYQVIFPPSVQWATQHSKVQFSNWPFSRQNYGGVDFTKGVNVSLWKNHPSPTSMFAFECQEDFLAGYDHGKHAGTLHIADHGIMPGKKFFTWGVGGEGKTWDNVLSDTDGPYLELMVGGYSDNQPDYSWIQPYEVKEVKEFWYPFRDIGGVKNANLDAAVNLEVEDGKAKIGVYTTEPRSGAKVTLTAAGKTIFEQALKTELAPGTPFQTEVQLPAGTREQDLRVAVTSKGRELVAYQPAVLATAPMPAPVTAPPPPEKIQTVEELYLTGQRLEQFHSPAREPDGYYLEAVKRDPGDYRANTALGLLYYRRALYAQAEQHLAKAVERVFRNYTRPRDGEAYYYLGMAQRAQGKSEAAADAFYRASWSYAWTSASSYALAEMAASRGEWAKALEHLDRALANNARSTKTMVLKAAVLRHMGRAEEADDLAVAALALDPLDDWAKYEVWLFQTLKLAPGAQPARDPAEVADLQPALEIAIGYASAGMYQDAAIDLEEYAAAQPAGARISPLVYYYGGYFQEKLGAADKAAAMYERARAAGPDFCFPFRLEELRILRHAAARNPQDSRAAYYLGNLLYDLQPAEAIKQWERARELEPGLAMVHRNLALAYARREHDLKKAVPSLEAAFERKQDPRWLYELDELYQAGEVAPEKRLDFFRKNQQVALDRDDTLTREIQLLVQTGNYDEALKHLDSRTFHIWEGAMVSAHDAWVDAHLLRGHKLLKAGKPLEAVKDYEAAREYPQRFGVGKPYGADRSAVMEYWIGAAYEAAGDAAKAREHYQTASTEAPGVSRRRRRAVDSAEVAFYQALALKKLGASEKAGAIFDGLVSSGQELLTRGAGVSDFAKFGERSAANVEQARAHYLMGLGHLGAGRNEQARTEFQQAVKLDVNQMWAAWELSAIK